MVDAAEMVADIGHDGPEGEHNERFRNRCALLIAVLAAVLAISSLGGGNATDDMLFNNIKASDTWAFYQAKNIRQTSYKVAADQLRRDLVALDPASAHGQAIAADIKKYEDAIERYENEPDPGRPGDATAGEGKAHLRARAQAYEAAREQAMERDSAFDLSEMILQLAIVLGSVAILALSRPLAYISVGLGVLGAILVADGYLLFFPIPF
jgi:hypothetical protein